MAIPPTRCRLAVIGADASTRHGVAIRLAAEPDMDVVVTGPVASGDGGEVLDAIVISCRRVDAHAIAALEEAAATHPGLPVVVLSLDDGERATVPDAAADVTFVSMHDGEAALLAALRRAAT